MSPPPLSMPTSSGRWCPMLKESTRDKSEKSSPAGLTAFCAYTQDPSEPSHIGKTILPAKNYNCEDQSEGAFLKGITTAFKNYQESRKGKKGKRTKDLWLDLCYSTPLGTHSSPLERAAIGALIVNQLAPNSPCRTAWHLDPLSGKDDLHVIISAITIDIPPRVTISSQFGGTAGKNIFAILNRTDKEISGMLRINPDRPTTINLDTPVEIRKKAKGRKKGTPSRLAKLLAALPDTITTTNIKAAIESLGFSCKPPRKNGIVVFFNKEQEGKPFFQTFPRLWNDIALQQSINKKSKKKKVVENPNNPEK